MVITFDPEADAAYIYLQPISRGGVAGTYVCDEPRIPGSVHLDFDAEGRLIGIEVLDATAALSKNALATALPPDAVSIETGE